MRTGYLLEVYIGWTEAAIGVYTFLSRGAGNYGYLMWSGGMDQEKYFEVVWSCAEKLKKDNADINLCQASSIAEVLNCGTVIEWINANTVPLREEPSEQKETDYGKEQWYEK